MVFNEVDPLLKVEWLKKDGDYVHKGLQFGKVHGRAHNIVVAERVVLNFMQRMSGIATLTKLELSSQVVGWKDTSKSVFDIWKEIFLKRKVKRARKSGNSCSSMSNEFEFLNSLISNCGNYDLILDGIHENILQLHYHDPVMQKTVATHLLSEKEKNDLAHTLRHEAVLDASVLSFDPPVGDFINFKGYTSGHFVLSLAVKQVLVHELSTLVLAEHEGGSINSQSVSAVEAAKSLYEANSVSLLLVGPGPSLREAAAHAVSASLKTTIFIITNWPIQLLNFRWVGIVKLSTLVLAEHEGRSINSQSVSPVEAANSLYKDNSVSLLLAGSGPSLREAAAHAASASLKTQPSS
ncbi:hypothetical protein F0562_015430 [Nyssa sinensis]|uniref:Quinolinate phosphoribosyl transferase N-terminal domain-containing protein n=1 Tax=Nyssa sinensis TaxID=561372 RepID=A0A5J4ZK59_9ASTE|nr:hypothetical protein F0562_015430 [Nyssa sinensis]